ncbi:hypothetical protein GLAREA_07661 [Glarea lozoyensis ATCC 20868]|uniref:Golgi apparatus membrane protein TVP38 n=1 Tax=Glarea lozoyensis (strain ATCC 20868 / MF5171) TaxID=1116229 RepID=S3D1U0_GLAL2|nr:uncharacterized protein GLAREA_07661 [Glarea lozoyensis ATCC 20868]EPE32527.1 hypothetical protein GLAREA_07661 [Glarea lozoyensis ATCC 20868]
MAIELKTLKPGGLEPEAEGVEEEVYEYKPFSWKTWHILVVFTVVMVILITVYHDHLVEVLRPISQKIRDLPGGFLIPVAILILISFPPLFGHELIALLCGVVYGLWIGFAIVAAGTFIGEVGTWYAFKYAFRRKAIKLERSNLNYGSLARLTRDGGFLVVLIVRFSAVPSHFSTAVFSTCDVKFWHFSVATFLTLPKQIIIVYFGVLLVQQTKNNTINTVVLSVTFLFTLIAAVYIYLKMKKTKVILLEEQESRAILRREKEKGFAFESNAEESAGSGH